MLTPALGWEKRAHQVTNPPSSQSLKLTHLYINLTSQHILAFGLDSYTEDSSLKLSTISSTCPLLWPKFTKFYQHIDPRGRGERRSKALTKSAIMTQNRHQTSLKTKERYPLIVRNGIKSSSGAAKEPEGGDELQ
eukprot:TRINITY_DN32751_c0_g1_i1.p1 TRINITY_DN32751_c0_g1~~TRINITY_DN32751_c0_g1_i1.p1  ORF type:complete len:135 (+),score=12.27 TRINITY_DN32751_c0_g1_i1:70-474(+)